MTSRLVKEDDEFLHLVNYMHEESDEYPDWLCTPDGRSCPDPKWPQSIIEADAHALYEIRAEYRIRKSDGKVFHDRFST